jgi:hypothetical protein
MANPRAGSLQERSSNGGDGCCLPPRLCPASECREPSPPTEVRPRPGGIILARAAGPCRASTIWAWRFRPGSSVGRTDPAKSRGKPISPEAKCGSDEDGLRLPPAILRLLIEAARVQAFSSACSPVANGGGGSGLFQPCCAACRSQFGAFFDCPPAPQTIFERSAGDVPNPT